MTIRIIDFTGGNASPVAAGMMRYLKTDIAVINCVPGAGSYSDLGFTNTNGVWRHEDTLLIEAGNEALLDAEILKECADLIIVGAARVDEAKTEWGQRVSKLVDKRLTFAFAYPDPLLGADGVLARTNRSLDALELGAIVSGGAGIAQGTGCIWGVGAYLAGARFVPFTQLVLKSLLSDALPSDEADNAFDTTFDDGPIFAFLNLDPSCPLDIDACALIADRGYRVIGICPIEAGISRRDGVGWGFTSIVTPGALGWPDDLEEVGYRLARTWVGKA